MNDNYLRNRPFLCVQISHRPAANAHTGKAGWQNNAEALKSFEKVTIVDRINSKMMNSAAVIIDVINSSVVKNNTGRDEVQLRAEYMGRHSEEIKAALTIWAVKEAKDRREA